MFVDTGYGQMHVRVSTPENQTNPPLLCLHMSPKSSWSYIEFMTMASNDRLVIAPDYPGMGESDKPPEEPPVRVQDYARTMWEIVDHFGLEKFDILGHHTGSKVAVEMAWKRPANVRKMVLVSVLNLTPEEEAMFKAMFEPVPLDEEGTRFTHMWDMIKKHRGPGMGLELMAESIAENMRGGEAYEWGHRAAFNYNEFFADRAAAIDHDVTILNPDDELYEFTIRAAPLFKNGRLENHKEWGHGFMKVFTEDAVKVVKTALD